MTPLPRFYHFYHTEAGGAKAVRCDLCPRRCALKDGESGVCNVRRNKGGAFDIPYYGYITALAREPIEKKPLYHFRPGSSILSTGFVGCNLHCPFCQNWSISQSTDAPGHHLEPAGLVAAASSKTHGDPYDAGAQIAYTYSEPLVHIEFLLDCMREAQGQGVANVLVTNGCVNPEPADEILNFTDAANIDLKCFSAETYSKILGGSLDAVLAFITRAFERGVHIELTTLVVPGLNDSDEELSNIVNFIAGLSKAIPWHLSAYHPEWKWDAPPTPPARLREIAAMARKKLLYVYTGNIMGEENETLCQSCGAVLAGRQGLHVDTRGLILRGKGKEKRFFCTVCAADAPFRF
jgi:pyruvate formate lyase activating enzyme